LVQTRIEAMLNLMNYLRPNVLVDPGPLDHPALQGMPQSALDDLPLPRWRSSLDRSLVLGCGAVTNKEVSDERAFDPRRD
jgi:hypothetical protein